MTATPLGRVVRTAAKVQSAEEALRAARRELREAIVAATDAGESQAALARSLGISRQRIRQILQAEDVGD